MYFIKIWKPLHFHSNSLLSSGACKGFTNAIKSHLLQSFISLGEFLGNEHSSINNFTFFAQQTGTFPTVGLNEKKYFGHCMVGIRRVLPH